MIRIDSNEYEQLYHLSQFANRRLQVSEVHEFILANCQGEKWRMEKAGNSLEERPIYQIRYGTGPIKILLWSQMHGNEATATRALLELFQFLNSPITPKNWADQLSLFFLPLLNPDGATAHIRENAAGIDINRDALTLSAPESTILHNALHTIKPNFSFNLHDQQIYYGIGNPCKQAAISLLAPPIDSNGSLNDNRTKALKMVVLMEKWLKSAHNLNVGKWKDEYERRAFGEYCQEAGSATILIEAGGLAHDWEKTKLSKYYFSLLLFSIQAILNEDYEKENIADYDAIPLNTLGIFDLIIRNVQVVIGKNVCKLDIGIRREDSPNSDGKSINQIGKIIEMGDLSYATGIEEFNANGTQISEQKFHPETFHTIPPADKAIKIMKQGFGAIQVKNISDYLDYMHFPLLIEPLKKEQSNRRFVIGDFANFCLINNGKMLANITNGYLHLIE
ncbi:M14 family zinc carboxypeptidase [Peijinzhouia sedimentorum]